MFTFRLSTKMRENINKTADDNTSTPSEVVRYALKQMIQDV